MDPYQPPCHGIDCCCIVDVKLWLLFTVFESCGCCNLCTWQDCGNTLPPAPDGRLSAECDMLCWTVRLLVSRTSGRRCIGADVEWTDVCAAAFEYGDRYPTTEDGVLEVATDGPRLPINWFGRYDDCRALPEIGLLKITFEAEIKERNQIGFIKLSCTETQNSKQQEFSW